MLMNLFAVRKGKKIYKEIYNFILDLNIYNKVLYGIIIIIFVITVIYGITVYTYAKKAFEQEAFNNARKMSVDISNLIDENLNQVDRIIASLYATAGETGLLSRTQPDKSEEYETLRYMDRFFQQLLCIRDDINSIFLYLSKTKYYSYYLTGVGKPDYNPETEPWYQETMDSRGKTLIIGPHKPYQLNRSNVVISFARQLKDSNLDPAGMIIVDINVSVLDNLVEKVIDENDVKVLFLDKNGELLYNKDNIKVEELMSNMVTKRLSDNASGKLEKKLSNEKYFITFYTSESANWKVVIFTPYNKIEKYGSNLFFFSLLMIIIILLCSAFISQRFSRFITNPIADLKKGMEVIEKGNFDFKLEQKSNDELGKLVLRFNIMVETIKKLIVEKYDETIARKDAEFKYLQAQINPHFIFNTLQIISTMAVINKTPEIKTVTKNLARILRNGIYIDNKYILIKEEIQNVISYLEIQKLRYKNLSYNVSVSEDINYLHIMKLILQPIIENSIIHGFEKQGVNGMININFKSLENKIYIEVVDNGMGILWEDMEKLRYNISSFKAETVEQYDKSMSVGLKNINHRIKLFYGEEYGIQIDSLYREWTKIDIILPINEKQGEG